MLNSLSILQITVKIPFHNIADSLIPRNTEIQEILVTNWASFQRLELHDLDIDASLAHVHHVVVNAWADVGNDFESFVATACGNGGISACNGRNDVLLDLSKEAYLDDSHCEHVGHSFDSEFLCSFQSSFVDPSHVLCRISVLFVKHKLQSSFLGRLGPNGSSKRRRCNVLGFLEFGR